SLRNGERPDAERPDKEKLVKDKHVRMIPFSEISKVKYNVAKGGSGTIHLGAWRNMHIAIKEQHNTNDLIKE
ncbi:hypothetical protein BGZ91_010037, partial [Linnemannia elongata]